MASRFDSLDNDTIGTILHWYAIADNESQTYLSDDGLADELRDTVRSRMPAHEYVAGQYSRYCLYGMGPVTCDRTRDDHTKPI